MIHRMWNDKPNGEVFIESPEQTDTLIRLVTVYRREVIHVTVEGFIVWLQIVRSIKARIIPVENIYY